MGLASLRVLVADDGSAISGLSAGLEEAGFQVVGVASDAGEAIEGARRTSPHVALISVRLPGGGVSATEGIVGGPDGCRVLALSAHEDRGAILHMLLAGAVGYVLKDAPSDEFAASVRRAAGDEIGSSADAMADLMGDLLREIADLSESEARLSRSEERFRGLVEAAPDAIVIVNQEGEIVLVNEQTELMFGYHRNDLLGNRVEVLVPERVQMTHIEHRMDYRSAPRTRRMGTARGLLGRRMKGEDFPVDISLSTVQTEEGALVIAFVRDMSERGRGAR
jgi:PAS domain S-box-containing protein